MARSTSSSSSSDHSTPSSPSSSSSSIDEEEEQPIDDAMLDAHIQILGQWERQASRSRNTQSESVDVRLLPGDDDDDEGQLDLDRLLQHLIRRMMERVLAGRPAPKLLSFAIQPAGWSRPFHIPLRPPQQNTPAAIAAALLRFLAEYDDVDIFDGACRTKVCAVWPIADGDAGPSGGCAQDMGQARAQAAGIARCQSWVPVVNPGGTDCLARAIVLGLADRRHRLLHLPNAVYRVWAEGQRGAGGAQNAQRLMLEAGIPLGQPSYGVADARRVQRWLDAQLGGPQHVRLVLLERERGWRVSWKSPTPAQFTLTIACCAGHWSYIQQPQQLFNAKEWCPDCEGPVSRHRHPQGCRVVCLMCYRWGAGFPCRKEAGQPTIRCPLCGFVFPNAGCFAAHRQRIDPAPPGWEHDRRRGRPHAPLCELRHQCAQCHQVYWRYGRGAAAAAHQCPQPNAIQLVGAAAADLCERCGGPHTGEQPCFVQPKVFTKQVQWANVDAMEDDDDDDDNLSDEGEEMEGGGRQKPRRKPVRFIFWDVETELIDDDDDDEPQPAAANEEDDDVDLLIERRHHTLLVCADVICELCIAAGVRLEEEPMRQAPGCFCGVPWRLDSAARRRWCQPADPTRRHAGTPWPVDGLNARRLAFHQFRLRPTDGQPMEWSEPMAQFVDFLLDHGPRGTRTICLAHNGGRYDIILLLEELQKRAIQPQKLITTGLRIYQLRLGGNNKRDIVLKDSLNFLGCALGALPATWGLDGVEDKPYFPYAFIRRANLHRVLWGLPPLAMYEPEGMKPTKRQHLIQWYGDEQRRAPNQRWVLSEQLLLYCTNDVTILREACLKFRQLVGECAGGIEPFDAASTIAGLTLASFRQNNLLANRVHHTPEGGFLRGRRASAESQRFFWVLERELGVHIQTAQWSIGEHRVAEDTGIRLDGFLQRQPPLRPLAIEFHGCFFHGCPTCFPDRQMQLAGGQSAEQLYARTQLRSWELEHRYGFEVREIWGCEWAKMLAGNKRLRTLYAQAQHHHLPGPLDLRKHALFGGRVEPFVLKYVCSAAEEIRVLDIVSLYPFVMKYRTFPLGHPQVITPDQFAADGTVAPMPWRHAHQNPFKGFLLCRVLPPRGQPAAAAAAAGPTTNWKWPRPLLPMRTLKGRLVFPLCRECAEHQQQQQPHRPCTHSEMERSWIAAYTDAELNRALGLGYSVLELFEVWNYAEWSMPGPHQLAGDRGLFSAYVDEWLRIKAEASGWPPGCDSPQQRRAYVDEFERREGISLRPDHIESNPGLRAIAKAFLNALWGKLAQRPDGENVEYTRTAREFHELLDDQHLHIMDFLHLNDHLDRVQTRLRPPFAKAAPTNALQIACFVTAHARLVLYDYMERIQEAGGGLLYCDTDSAIHVRRLEDPPCLPEGDYLGDMKRELPHRDIREWVCGGPKNYALLHRCARTGGDERADMKVRSIELTHEARQMLTYRRMCRLVERQFGDAAAAAAAPGRIRVPQRRFVRNRRAQIFTKTTHKIYKPVYTKGIVLENLHTRPFGWFFGEEEEVADDSDVDMESTDDDDTSGDEEEEESIEWDVEEEQQQQQL